MGKRTGKTAQDGQNLSLTEMHFMNWTLIVSGEGKSTEKNRQKKIKKPEKKAAVTGNMITVIPHDFIRMPAAVPSADLSASLQIQTDLFTPQSPLTGPGKGNNFLCPGRRIGNSSELPNPAPVFRPEGFMTVQRSADQRL